MRMMVRNAAWFQNILQDIRNEVRIENNLNELKSAFKQLNQSNISELASNLPLDIIFECLNSSNINQILLTCEILNILLSGLPPNLAIDRYIVPLQRVLIHPQKEVKEMAIQEFIRALPEILHSDLVDRDQTLLLNITNCLCDGEISVANKAIEFLSKFGQTRAGLAAICRPEIKEAILTSTSQNDVYKIRLYQVVIEIGTNCPDSLPIMKKHGFIEGLIRDIKSDDVLSQLAVLEELSKLAITRDGFTFLQNENVIKLLVEQIKDSRDHVMASIVFPGLLKFFGNIAQKFPDELISTYPDVSQAVFESVDSDEYVIAITGMETVGFIATSAIGKSVLCRQDEQCMRHILSKMNEASQSFPIEWRIRAVHAIANMIHIEEGYLTTELMKITELWFNMLNTNAMEILFKMAQQPFPEMNLAVLQVLKEMAVQKWGQIKINACPGVMNFLMDRTTTSTLNGGLAKYDIITRMVNSPSGIEVFGEAQFMRLQEFVKQGPCNGSTDFKVALEGEP